MSEHIEKLVISDLDDTIKISHSTSHFKTIIRGLFFSHAYTGMSELYQAWGSLGFHIKILSSSPTWIEKKIHGFLNLHNFPERSLHLRDWIKETEIKKYKQKSIRKILEKTPNFIILVGDDTEWDPEVFAEMKKEFPDKVKKIYIRAVRNRPLPDPEMISFYTAFDVATHEYVEKRIDLSSLKKIADAIIEEKNMDFIFPHFVSRPQKATSHQNAEIESLRSEIEKKLLKKD